jgi:hypothetical protein
VGDDPNWTGHDLAQANFYGFGRLAWDPELSAPQIADEWARLTFGNDPVVVRIVSWILENSWPAYERLTSPLGVGLISNSDNHYTPGLTQPVPQPEALDSLQSDSLGVGYDRTHAGAVKRGFKTSFLDEYHPSVRAQFENLATCPDNLVLFMHHVPYSYKLKSGKTVIQHIYDSHYDGYWDILRLQKAWETLAGHLDADTFARVREKLKVSVRDAGDLSLKNLSWLRAVYEYFRELSQIPDAYESESSPHHFRESLAMDFSASAPGETQTTQIDWAPDFYETGGLPIAIYDLESADEIDLSLNGMRLSAPPNLANPNQGTTVVRIPLTAAQARQIHPGPNTLTVKFNGARVAPVSGLRLLKLGHQQ